MVTTSLPALAELVIAPIGDSITQADWAHKSYRYNLWTKLLDAGVQFDLAGSHQEHWLEPDNGVPTFPLYQGQSFDRDNEGHWGWKVRQISDQIDGWLTQYTPDIALVHLGTVNLYTGESAESTLAEMSTLIDQLRAANPDMIIILGQVMLEGPNYDAYRSGIAALAVEKDTPQSPVVVVAHNEGWDADDHTYDTVHPNELGEEKLAQNWFLALSPLLDLQVRLTITRQDDQLHLTFPSVNGTTYSLFESEDLINWSHLEDATATGPSHTFIQPVPAGNPVFFKVEY
jgi:hypothetical protein